MVLAAKPMFWGMRNHLGPFSEASDRPEGQELGGRAVGGQEGLQEVNFNLGSNSASEHARYSGGTMAEIIRLKFNITH